MRIKKVFLLLVPLLLFLVLIGVLLVVFRDRLSAFKKQAVEKTGPVASKQVKAELEQSSVVVYDQRPVNKVIVGEVMLDQSGYVVIHVGSDAGPGDVVGASRMLGKGVHTNVEVPLSRTMRDGETFYAVLYMGDGGSFDKDVDKPLLNKQGGQIMAVFLADADAPTDIQVDPSP